MSKRAGPTNLNQSEATDPVPGLVELGGWPGCDPCQPLSLRRCFLQMLCPVQSEKTAPGSGKGGKGDASTY
jgi:hypothetical protein